MNNDTNKAISSLKVETIVRQFLGSQWQSQRFFITIRSILSDFHCEITMKLVLHRLFILMSFCVETWKPN